MISAPIMNPRHNMQAAPLSALYGGRARVFPGDVPHTPPCFQRPRGPQMVLNDEGMTLHHNLLILQGKKCWLKKMVRTGLEGADRKKQAMTRCSGNWSASWFFLIARTCARIGARVRMRAHVAFYFVLRTTDQRKIRNNIFCF